VVLEVQRRSGSGDFPPVGALLEYLYLVRSPLVHYPDRQQERFRHLSLLHHHWMVRPQQVEVQGVLAVAAGERRYFPDFATMWR
jgi:hypothetical protein